MMSDEFDPKEFLSKHIAEIQPKVTKLQKQQFEMNEGTGIDGITVEEFTVLRMYFEDGLSYVDVFLSDVNMSPDSATLHYFPEGLSKQLAYEITDDDMIEKLYQLISDIMDVTV